MKRRYKLLIAVSIVQYVVISALSDMNVKVESLLGSAIGTLMFILPIQILLFMLSKDEKYSDKKMLFKVVFWYINICYVVGIIANLVAP